MATTVAGVTYTSTTLSLDGLDWATLVAAAVQPGDITPSVTPNSFTNTGKTLFVLVNGGAGPKTVTFNAGSCNFGTDHDKSVTVLAGLTRVLGAFPMSEFGSTVTFSCGAADTDVADVKVFILEVPFVN
jgi:hypothetical protein